MSRRVSQRRRQELRSAFKRLRLLEISADTAPRRDVLPYDPEMTSPDAAVRMYQRCHGQAGIWWLAPTGHYFLGPPPPQRSEERQ